MYDFLHGLAVGTGLTLIGLLIGVVLETLEHHFSDNDMEEVDQ